MARVRTLTLPSALMSPSQEMRRLSKAKVLPGSAADAPANQRRPVGAGNPPADPPARYQSTGSLVAITPVVRSAMEIRVTRFVSKSNFVVQ